MDPVENPINQTLPQEAAKKTWPWIVLILILAVGLSFLGWWLYQTYKPKPTPPDPMDVANWQTYESFNLGVTVKYPQTANFQILEKSIIFTDKNETALVLNFEKIDNPLFDLAYLVNDRKETFLHPRVMSLDNILAYEGVDVGPLNYYGVYVLNNSYLMRFDFPTANKNSLTDLKSDLSEVQNKILQNIEFSTITLSDTKDWKTYSNNALKYSINYPADWEYKEINESTTGFTSSKENWQLKGSKSYPIQISVTKVRPKNAEYKTKLNTAVGGQKGIKYIGVPGLLSSTEIVVENNGEFYDFQVEEGTATAKIAEPIFAQMISSFKFIE
jgi:hypothetical protein